MELPRLPRRVEDEPRAAGLARELASRARPLWPGAELRAVGAGIGPALEAALRSAHATGQIIRGLEQAGRVLAAEGQGLGQVDRRTGVERGARVSRLLILAGDGSQRFYRGVEALLRRHTPRVLALRLGVDGRALGELLFGPDRVARLLLVAHRDAVSSILLALAEQWTGEPPNPGEGDREPPR